ncbi:MAG: DUF2937 family protein [Beijerinckiaceae bacterium]|jgi:hypothetical protein|nr:DUF2937 family protein [Beijerinckiaceae bacterium]MDO9439860.1 DUF2937 family protein [Beijerinckiaceae bacterium]
MIIRRIVFFISLMIGAAASQLPEFAQQYRQRLGGAIDEINRMLGDFDRDAASNGMDRPAGVGRLQKNNDPFVQSQGARVREAEARVSRLERQLQDFSQAGSFSRIGVLARDFDPGIARRAYQSFEPAVPLTLEGGTIAATGFAAAYALLKMLGALGRRVRRRSTRPGRVHVS